MPIRLLAVLASVLLLPAFASQALAADSGAIRGQVQGSPLPGAFRVALYQAIPGRDAPQRLGATRTRRGGAFQLTYRGARTTGVKYLLATRPGGGAEAGYPVPVSSYRLAAALGDREVPRRVTLNERTTVATAFAMAQFIRGGRIAGENPGLRNSAAMARSLVDRGGGLSRVMTRFPNGRSTSTLPTFNSLANLVASCRYPGRRCASFLRLASRPGGAASVDTFAAVNAIARYPWHATRGLYRLGRLVRQLYRPALGRGDRPDAWTLALRFEGVPRTMDGPGNLAFDARGTIWVVNNYEYNRDATEPVCAGEQLLRFTPTGRGYPGSPYEGGGINGVGYGITFDPRGRIWVSNFGFAGRGCDREPPRNSVSLFRPNGEALSPDFHTVERENEDGETEEVTVGGFEQGEISEPQGIVSDRDGNILTVNCGNGVLTRYLRGDPNLAQVIRPHRTGLENPFDAAIDASGTAYVTGNASDSVAILDRRGEPAGEVTGGGLHRPMGIASDSRGYMWVANSGKVVAPCKGSAQHIEKGASQGSVVGIGPDGKLLRQRPFGGAGMQTPWGIAVDGDDTVWVANFTGQRVSQVCGMRTRLCPPGKRRTGAAISPNGSGYGFDGLVRVTGLQVDPSGNVWMVNNWKQAPIQSNPGGYQLVAFLGAAEPIKTPLIGPPERP